MNILPRLFSLIQQDSTLAKPSAGQTTPLEKLLIAILLLQETVGRMGADQLSSLKF